MSEKLLRGRVLTFLREPRSIDDAASYRYHEDGALLIRDGVIAAAGDFSEIRQQADTAIEVIDHRPHLLLPGFIDTHTHYPQMQVIGSYGTQLLDWLNTYTFPEEARFGEAAHARRIADAFFDDLLRNGTTTAVAYCTVHKESAEAYFEAAAERNLLAIGGKVLMDRNAPRNLTDTAQSGYDDSKDLICQMAWYRARAIRDHAALCNHVD